MFLVGLKKATQVRLGSFLYNKVYTPLLFFQQFGLLDVLIDVHSLIRLEVLVFDLGEGFYSIIVFALLHQDFSGLQ